MGRVEERRLRQLELCAEGAAWDAATSRLDLDELLAIAAWYSPALEADAAGVRRPQPTPEQAQAVVKWHALYEEAYREGGSRLYAPPGASPDDYLG